MSEQVARVIPLGEAVGAATGFEEFYLAERDRLHRALLLITRNSGEADDILQESFCRVWERWERVHNLESPTGYLYRVAMNLYRSAYRRAITMTKRTFTPADAPDPFEAVEIRDDALRLLAKLTRRQRAAVVLTELLGYASDEAGEILGIRGGSVRTLVSQARERLGVKEAADE